MSPRESKIFASFDRLMPVCKILETYLRCFFYRILYFIEKKTKMNQKHVNISTFRVLFQILKNADLEIV